MVSSSGMRQNRAEKMLHCTVSKISYVFVTCTYKLQSVLIKAPIIPLKHRKYQNVSSLKPDGCDTNSVLQEHPCAVSQHNNMPQTLAFGSSALSTCHFVVLLPYCQRHFFSGQCQLRHQGYTRNSSVLYLAAR